MKPHILTTLLVLLLFASTGRAQDAAKKLADEYERRKAAALKPVEDWYAVEVKRLNELAQRSGNPEEARQARQLSMAKMLASKKWEWSSPGGPFPVTWNADGTGSHPWAKFKWDAFSDKELLLTRDNGQELRLSLVGTSWTGVKDFDGTNKKVEIRVALDKKKK